MDRSTSKHTTILHMCVNHESIAYITDKTTLPMIYIQGVQKLELRSVSESKRVFLCQAI